MGDTALHNNTEGGANTAMGYQALYQNTLGTYNRRGPKRDGGQYDGAAGTAVGYGALQLTRPALKTRDRL